MPYNPNSFLGAASLPTQGAPGIASAPEDIMRAYLSAQAPERQRQEMLAKQLANQRGQFDVDHQGEAFKSKQDLIAAQMQKALQGNQYAPSPLGKAMSEYNQIIKQYGENSPQAAQYKQYVARLSEGSPGMQFSFDPESKAMLFSQGGSGRGSMAQGIVDGKVVNKPTMATQSGVQKSSLANKGFTEIANDVKQPYVGEFPSFEIGRDLLKYKSLPEGPEKEAVAAKLVKANVANRFIPEMAALQLTSQGTPATVPAIQHQTDVLKTGWPLFSQALMNSFPKELQERSEKEHAKAMQKSAKVKQLFAAKGMPIDTKEDQDNKSFDVKSMSTEELMKIAGGK